MNKPIATILIPAHNEDDRRLRKLLALVLESGYSIILVDDGSSKPFEMVHPDIVIIRHEINLGQGAALETGMQYAREKNIHPVVHMDADGQHSVDDILSVLRPVLSDQADIVFGSRFLRQTDKQVIPPFRRRILYLARKVNRFLTGADMTDAHNGFRALNEKALSCISLQSSGRPHASEIVYRAVRQSLRIQEVPVHVRYDSSFNVKRIHLGELVQLGFSLLLHRLKGYNIKHPRVHEVQQNALQSVKRNLL